MSRFDLDYMQAEIDALKAENDGLRERLGEWRECAEELAERLRLRGLFSGLFGAEKIALAEFERLKEASK